MKKYRTLHEVEVEHFKKHPDEISGYLEVCLEEYEQDGDIKALLSSLRVITEAKGGITKLAEETGLNRENLYKALSEKGNPRFSTLTAILDALGYTITFKPKRAA